jgi:hypothetical protein
MDTPFDLHQLSDEHRLLRDVVREGPKERKLGSSSPTWQSASKPRANSSAKAPTRSSGL